MSDQDRISPYNIKYNIKKTSDENKGKYQQGITSWPTMKFSEPSSKELYDRVRRITNEIRKIDKNPLVTPIFPMWKRDELPWVVLGCYTYEILAWVLKPLTIFQAIQATCVH